MQKLPGKTGCEKADTKQCNRRATEATSLPHRHPIDKLLFFVSNIRPPPGKREDTCKTKHMRVLIQSLAAFNTSYHARQFDLCYGHHQRPRRPLDWLQTRGEMKRRVKSPQGPADDPVNIVLLLHISGRGVSSNVLRGVFRNNNLGVLSVHRTALQRRTIQNWRHSRLYPSL